FRDGGDELGPPPPLDQVPGWLARLVELPMLAWGLVRGVDDRPFEERVGHSLRVLRYQPSRRHVLVEVEPLAGHEPILPTGRPMISLTWRTLTKRNLRLRDHHVVVAASIGDDRLVIDIGDVGGNGVQEMA